MIQAARLSLPPAFLEGRSVMRSAILIFVAILAFAAAPIVWRNG